MRRVQAVLAAAVCRFSARRSGEGDDRSGGCDDLGQSGDGGASAARERVVAAGIPDHDVERVLDGFHLFEHQADVESPEGDFVFALDGRVDRHQVVASLHLHAVPGVVEQANARLERVAELAHRLVHLRPARVFNADHPEAQLVQRCGHCARIVERVAERHGFVVGIADRQRHAWSAVECRWRSGGGLSTPSRQPDRAARADHLTEPRRRERCVPKIAGGWVIARLFSHLYFASISATFFWTSRCTSESSVSCPLAPVETPSTELVFLPISIFFSA